MNPLTSSIVTQPSLRGATVPHTGPYAEIGTAFARLETTVRNAGLRTPADSLIAIYHDNPGITPAAELRSEAGLVVEESTQFPAELSEARLAAGRYLHHRHRGSYEGLPAAWAYLRERGLQEHGVTRRPGPSYEIYPNNPGSAAAGDLITDIYIPVTRG
jgi:AraC family transcriptional regulator